jgi:hypothetical protein
MTPTTVYGMLSRRMTRPRTADRPDSAVPEAVTDDRHARARRVVIRLEGAAVLRARAEHRKEYR